MGDFFLYFEWDTINGFGEVINFLLSFEVLVAKEGFEKLKSFVEVKRVL